MRCGAVVASMSQTACRSPSNRVARTPSCASSVRASAGTSPGSRSIHGGPDRSRLSLPRAQGPSKGHSATPQDILRGHSARTPGCQWDHSTRIPVGVTVQGPQDAPRGHPVKNPRVHSSRAPGPPEGDRIQKPASGAAAVWMLRV